MMSNKKTVSDVLVYSFARVYPSSSVDIILLDKDLSPSSAKFEYLKNPITMATSFFAIPNHYEVGTDGKPEKQSLTNIAKNFFGWQSNKSTSRQVFNILLMPFVTVFNLISAVVSTSLNIVRFFTEFLPRAAADLCEFGANEASKKIKSSTSSIEKIGYSALFGLASVGQFIFEVIHFVGQAVTSPIQSMKSSVALGKKIVRSIDKVTGSDFERNNTVTKIVGGTLAVLSAVTSIVAYTVLLPLAITAAGVAAVSSQAPVWIKAIGSAVTNTIAALPTFISTIGAAIPSIAASSATAASVGLSFLVGAAITTVGSVAKSLFSRLTEKWHRSGNDEVASSPVKRDKSPNLKADDDLGYRGYFSTADITNTMNQKPDDKLVVDNDNDSFNGGKGKVVNIIEKAQQGIGPYKSFLTTTAPKEIKKADIGNNDENSSSYSNSY